MEEDKDVVPRPDSVRFVGEHILISLDKDARITWPKRIQIVMQVNFGSRKSVAMSKCVKRDNLAMGEDIFPDTTKPSEQERRRGRKAKEKERARVSRHGLRMPLGSQKGGRKVKVKGKASSLPEEKEKESRKEKGKHSKVRKAREKDVDSKAEEEDEALDEDVVSSMP